MDSQQTVDEENMVDPTPNEDTSPGSSNEILSTTEAVGDFPISSGSNLDTIATKPDVSLVDDMMPVEDFPRTRVNPKVSSNKKSDRLISNMLFLLLQFKISMSLY